MADQHHYRQQQPQHQGYQSRIQFDNPQHQGYQTHYHRESFRPQNGSSASNLLTIATLVPVGGTLLLLAGLTMAGTIIGLAVLAVVVVFLSVTGILTSGALGVTALSSFSWLAHYLSRSHLPQTMGQKVQETTGYLGQKVPETTGYLGQKVQETGDFVGHKMQETGGQVGQMTQDVGETIQNKGRGKTGRAKEGGRSRDGVSVTVRT
ncbi:oleosin 16.4 kDa-like [Pyrus ussuriensis x Pyrus communis]|uniref:Oleosin 16.4 kDa-like n=1 Tax=Pyrus ussuriensis x Pyrus communis TaxID=2448454 RepID=A0A5N5G6F1_9ROSA|nr:oleosin 16.4 kDa-like [Pyrus ussuriensis x Pyrus communis]